MKTLKLKPLVLAIRSALYGGFTTAPPLASFLYESPTFGAGGSHSG